MLTQINSLFLRGQPVYQHLQPEQDHWTCNQNRIKHLQPEQDSAQLSAQIAAQQEVYSLPMLLK